MSKTLTKSNPNAETLLISLLEDLCYLYECDEGRSKLIFNKICHELDRMGIVSKKSYNEKNKPVRKLYKSVLIKLINSIRFNVIEDLDENKLILDKSSDSILSKPSDLIRVFKNNNIEEPILKTSTMDNLIKNYSRLHHDFIELERIGKGGFGEVFKMYHKIDSIIYAVKKISIENFDKNNFDKILNEVRSIAKLNHPNIIRYYNSWIEYDISKNNLERESDEEEEEEEAVEIDPVFDAEDSIEIFESKSNNFSQLKLKLFIQMELCDLNLKEWIERRNDYETFDYNNSKNIFMQIVNGLHFVHQNDLIHRDIKPANIFLFNIFKDKHIPEDKLDDFNYIIKIADFGLSKEKIKLDTGVKNTIIKKEKYDTSNLGTAIYASPEQLDSYNYDYKTDLFSLGIILFELFYCNKTEMERSINIKNLRDSYQLPSDFEFKEEASLIKKLVQHDSSLRPNTDEIIESYFNN